MREDKLTNMKGAELKDIEIKQKNYEISQLEDKT